MANLPDYSPFYCALADEAGRVAAALSDEDLGRLLLELKKDETTPEGRARSHAACRALLKDAENGELLPLLDQQGREMRLSTQGRKPEEEADVKAREKVIGRCENEARETSAQKIEKARQNVPTKP